MQSAYKTTMKYFSLYRGLKLTSGRRGDQAVYIQNIINDRPLPMPRVPGTPSIAPVIPLIILVSTLTA